MGGAPILICYDGSTGAKRAIDAAAHLLGPGPAVVLHVGVVMTPAEAIAATDAVIPGNAFEELNAADALPVAREGAELARAAGFDAEARVGVGGPTWQGIVDLADELDAPLIVIGSRGLSGLREAFEGSISHDVVEHARRPVLVVPPPRAAS